MLLPAWFHSDLVLLLFVQICAVEIYLLLVVAHTVDPTAVTTAVTAEQRACQDAGLDQGMYGFTAVPGARVTCA